MKKIYLKPGIDKMKADLGSLICGSKDIYSDKGIDYGGLDEEGGIAPASRKYNVWDYDDEEEEER